jgi:hypothetical protein
MLSEKFFLVLETLLSHAEPDGSTRVVSTSAQIPIRSSQKRTRAGDFLFDDFLRLDREADCHLA